MEERLVAHKMEESVNKMEERVNKMEERVNKMKESVGAGGTTVGGATADIGEVGSLGLGGVNNKTGDSMSGSAASPPLGHTTSSSVATSVATSAPATPLEAKQRSFRVPKTHREWMEILNAESPYPRPPSAVSNSTDSARNFLAHPPSSAPSSAGPRKTSVPHLLSTPLPSITDETFADGKAITFEELRQLPSTEAAPRISDKINYDILQRASERKRKDKMRAQGGEIRAGEVRAGERGRCFSSSRSTGAETPIRKKSNEFLERIVMDYRLEKSGKDQLTATTATSCGGGYHGHLSDASSVLSDSCGDFPLPSESAKAAGTLWSRRITRDLHRRPNLGAGDGDRGTQFRSDVTREFAH
ncbi:unnamed protein product [Amoebophrya sp. A25]|nr:unnamed protein product [Amoebophrya sp. A25]|eukprot:GSA25T00027450001.1